MPKSIATTVSAALYTLPVPGHTGEQKNHQQNTPRLNQDEVKRTCWRWAPSVNTFIKSGQAENTTVDSGIELKDLKKN